MIHWKKVLLVILILSGCKKAFTPSGITSSNSHYLVIEGTVNSGTDSTYITLSRTKSVDTSTAFIKETGAHVTLESSAGTTYPLIEITTGTYATPGLNLNTSHQYRLRINTSNSEQYLSDYVVVKNAPPIDSIGFKAQNTGVQIYLNTHDNTDATRYYRWEYNESWEFHSWYKSLYDDSGERKISVYYCYTGDQSASINIANSIKLANDVIYQAPIIMIPATSEKIELKYSILVKQYALTSDAYSFWQNLQTNNTGLGSIFDAQPSLNQTNYHCLNNPAETVVGYLSVGVPSTKRIFISASQLLPGYSPADLFGCSVITDTTAHPNPDIAKAPPGYYTILDLLPPYSGISVPFAVTFAKTDCADCTVRGTLTPPSFWK
jgi:hypothetical protein